MTTNLPAAPVELYTADLPSKGFKVYEIEEHVSPMSVQSRRDYYKIALVTGELTIHSGEQTIEAKGPFLFLANPHVPHSVVDHSAGGKRFACLFTEAFIAGRQRTELLRDSPLFRVDAMPVIPLDSEQAGFIAGLFQQMLAVYRGDYTHKNELLKACLELILHEALIIQPTAEDGKPKSITIKPKRFGRLSESGRSPA